jgi:hypothetical protein
MLLDGRQLCFFGFHAMSQGTASDAIIISELGKEISAYQ